VRYTALGGDDLDGGGVPVSHFMQVPFRTSLELPHSLHISL
jgi:hypothetical protein